MTIASISGAMITFAAGNLAIALPLGLIAWWLQRQGTQPFLAHLLWLVVLVKLVTPPLYSVPVGSLPQAVIAQGTLPSVPTAGDAFGPAPDPGWFAALDWQAVAVAFWFVGSVFVLVWSLLRVHRFSRLLRETSRPAAPTFQNAASRITSDFGLDRVPAILTTTARISPMVWPFGSPVRIYLPQTMVEKMSRAELDEILAHEVAHVRRRDHFVRWLEWLVCVALWWNPVAWWARRNLRVCEEICCDAFVLRKTQVSRDAYAGAFISAMELLAVPTIRPSGMASQVTGGGIERRIRMILSGKSVLETPRWLRGVVFVSAALVIPLGFTLAQDADDFERVEQWLQSGVNSAFLTEEQAKIMLNALRGAETEAEMVTRTIRIENIPAVQLVPVLRPMMTQRAQLSAVRDTNTLILVESSENMKRIAGLIEELDQANDEDVEVVPTVEEPVDTSVVLPADESE